MAESAIRFEDGAAYEQGMGRWSALAGQTFLDWLAPPASLRWLDIGCGSGAFTELVVQRCAPSETHGVDPSEAQLVFARSRPGARGATFHLGDAMTLPFPDDRFDAAAMALVIFFVPEPAKCVAEMMRVVRPGGTVAAYAWDMLNGGFPFEPIRAELRAQGLTPPMPPSVEISRLDALRELWTASGLEAVEAREIAAQRTFTDFEEFWSTSTGTTGTMRQLLGTMTQADAERLKRRVRASLPADPQGRITCGARANAIKGRVPTGS